MPLTAQLTLTFIPAPGEEDIDIWEFWVARGLHEGSETDERCMEPERGTSDPSPCDSGLALILNSTTLLFTNSWSASYPEEPRK